MDATLKSILAELFAASQDVRELLERVKALEEELAARKQDEAGEEASP